jgi:hypothetical protein
MTEIADFLPSGLRPPGLRLPSVVLDALPGDGRLERVTAPPEHQRLMSRMDAKFIAPRAALAELLDVLADDYVLLTAAGEPAARYVTVYFDTGAQDFLNAHLRGRRPRHKLRVRHYVDRQLSSLEIKSRMPGGRTDKTQRPQEFGSNRLASDAAAWAQALTGVAAPLGAQAWTSCQRITLLHVHTACRMTIDLNVSLGNRRGARTLQDRALVELKREQSRGDPALSRALHAAGARPVSLSKYVAAMMVGDGDGGERRARFIAVLGRLARSEYWQECPA